MTDTIFGNLSFRYVDVDLNLPRLEGQIASFSRAPTEIQLGKGCWKRLGLVSPKIIQTTTLNRGDQSISITRDKKNLGPNEIIFVFVFGSGEANDG